MLIPIVSIVYIFLRKKNNMELYSYPNIMKSLFTAFIYFSIFKSKHTKNIFYAYFFTLLQ